jgi:hypothetical protein
MWFGAVLVLVQKYTYEPFARKVLLQIVLYVVPWGPPENFLNLKL